MVEVNIQLISSYIALLPPLLQYFIQPCKAVNNKPFSWQPSLKEIVGSTQALPLTLIKVLFLVLLLFVLAHWIGSATLKGTEPSYILLITPEFTCDLAAVKKVCTVGQNFRTPIKSQRFNCKKCFSHYKALDQTGL